ncbi:MAG: hypothetical protein HC912_13155 [Saprospiraceae bacterium]|nr:hypothetical protein [Saprospiraceae bacterium]
MNDKIFGEDGISTPIEKLQNYTVNTVDITEVGLAAEKIVDKEFHKQFMAFSTSYPSL